MRDRSLETRYMRMYYIRWAMPSPDPEDPTPPRQRQAHTVAIASSRSELFMLLDEDADAADEGVLLKQLPAQALFALDFKMIMPADRDADMEPLPGDPEALAHAEDLEIGPYETSYSLLQDLGELADGDLTPAREFFNGVVAFPGDPDRGGEHRAHTRTETEH